MQTTSESETKNRLSLFDSTSLIVGIIVGIGIYETSPAIASCMSSWQGLLAVWLLGGLLSLAGALCYAELASALPDEGGDFVYLNRAYGQWAGFLFAWSRTFIIRPGSIALMAFPFARYLQTIFSPLAGTAWEPHTHVLFASAAILVLTAINCLGVTKGTATQNILTVLKVFILLLILCVAGLSDTEAGINSPVTHVTDAGGFRLALILVLFTYGGWSEIAYVAAEVRQPEKNLLRSMVLGTLCVTVLYVGVNLFFMRVLGLSGMAESTAVATDVVAILWPGAASASVSLAICLSALGALQGLIFTGARISFALGSSHRIFSYFAFWNYVRGVPTNALLVQGLLSVIFVVVSGSFDMALVYTSSVVWLFYLLTGLGLFILRVREPNLHRPYHVALYPLTPVVFCLSSAFLMYSSFTYSIDGSLVAIGVCLAGLPLLWLSKKVFGSDPSSELPSA